MVAFKGQRCEIAWEEIVKFETIILIILLALKWGREAYPYCVYYCFTTFYHLILQFYNCLLLVFYLFTQHNIDSLFRTVSRHSRGPSWGSPAPLGSVPRRFEKVRGSWRRFEKVGEGQRRLEKVREGKIRSENVREG